MYVFFLFFSFSETFSKALFDSEEKKNLFTKIKYVYHSNSVSNCFDTVYPTLRDISYTQNGAIILRLNIFNTQRKYEEVSFKNGVESH